MKTFITTTLALAAFLTLAAGQEVEARRFYHHGYGYGYGGYGYGGPAYYAPAYDYGYPYGYDYGYYNGGAVGRVLRDIF